MVQMLQVTFIIQQHAAPKNIVIERLRKLRENDENIKLKPPIIAAPNKIVCSWKQPNRYLTRVPPKM